MTIICKTLCILGAVTSTIAPYPFIPLFSFVIYILYSFNIVLACIMQVVRDDISQLIESQQELETNFENAVNHKKLGAGDASHNDVQSAAADLRSNAAVFALSLKQNPLATDNLEKVQSDRF